MYCYDIPSCILLPWQHYGYSCHHATFGIDAIALGLYR